MLAKASCTVIERKHTLVLKSSNETFCLFFSKLLLSGCHKLPERKIYRETFPDTFVKVISDSMPRLNKLFFEISIIVATNNLINKNNSRSFVIVYKKTDEWYIEWHRVKTNGTTSENEWQQVMQRVTTSCARSGNEWQQLRQRMTTSDNE